MAKSLLWIVFGRLATALLALLTIRTATSVLAPEQFGLLSLLVAVQSMCGLFLVNPVGQHINRHTHAWWEEETLLARFKTYSHWVIAAGLIGAAATTMAPHESGASIGDHLLRPAMVFAMVVAATWNATWVWLLNMLDYRRASVLWGIASVGGGLTASWLFTLLWPTAEAWFAGQAMGFAAGAIGARASVRRRARPAARNMPAQSFIDLPTLKSYCLPLAVATGLMWVQLSGYRFLVGEFWGLTALGLIALGLGIASQIWGLLESLAMQYLYPIFFQKIKGSPDSATSSFSDLINTLGPSYVALSGAMALGAPTILWILADARYSNAAMFLGLGMAIELFRVLGGLFGTASQIHGNTRQLILPWATGAGAIVLLLLVVQGHDILWAALALLAGGALMLGALTLNVRRTVTYRVDILRWGVSAVFFLACHLLPFLSPTAWKQWSQSGSAMAFAVLLTASVMTALLWKNPSALRLLGWRQAAVRGG